MAGKGSVFIQILGDSTGLTAATSKAQASLAGLEAKTASASASSSMFGKVSTMAFVAAGAAVVGFAIISVKAYEEHQKSLVNLQSVIKSTPTLVGASVKAFEDQALALQNLTGYQHDEVIAADAVLGRVGLTQKEIMGAMPSILGMARALGVDVPTAASLVSRALLGNARGMKSLGIQFKATGNITKDYATILAALKSRGLDQLALAFGQTLPGKIAIFDAKLHTLEETSGKALLPVVTGIVSALTGLLDVLAPLASKLPLILGVLVGFKALTFLPALLNATAGGMLKVAVASGSELLFKGALALEGLGTAAAASLGPIALVGASLFVLYKMFTAGNITITTYNQALRMAGTQLGRDAGAAKIAARAHQILNEHVTKTTGSVTNAELAAFRLAGQQQALAQQTNKVADALVKEQEALTQLAGGYLGVQSAALAVQGSTLTYRGAVQQLNKDLRLNTDANKKNNVSALQLKQDQLAVKQAMLGRVQAQVSLTSSIQDFADKELAAGVSTGDVIKKVRGFAAQAGLTKKQTQTLIDAVITLGTKYGDLPNSVKTSVFAPGLNSVTATAKTLDNMLNNMNGRQVAIYFKTHGIGGNAAGTSNWRGGLTWVGERGAELVDLPAGSRVYPHGRSESMARAGAGGMVVNLHVHGSVVTERDLVEQFRKVILQVAARNGGRTGF
jgi:hypothetical protein